MLRRSWGTPCAPSSHLCSSFPRGMRRVLISGVALALLALPAGDGAAKSSGQSITKTKVYKSADGVAIHSSRTAVTFTFSGRSRKALRAWRGRSVGVRCKRAPAPNAYGDSDDYQWSSIRVGQHATKIRAVVDGTARWDLCIASATVRSGKFKGTVLKTRYVVPVGITKAGVVAVEDSETARNIAIAFELLAQESLNGRPPTIDAAVAYFAQDRATTGPRFVALPDPAATPARTGDIGYWSDGDQHAVIAARSPSGRRLFKEAEANGVVRSNIDKLVGLVDTDPLLD